MRLSQPWKCQTGHGAESCRASTSCIVEGGIIAGGMGTLVITMSPDQFWRRSETAVFVLDHTLNVIMGGCRARDGSAKVSDSVSGMEIPRAQDPASVAPSTKLAAVDRAIRRLSQRSALDPRGSSLP